MPKAPLIPKLAVLEGELIDTLLAGLAGWRPDLKYPESHSDMEACVRAVMVMFEVKRRGVPEPLMTPCHDCRGAGIFKINPTEGRTCETCRGRGELPLPM